GAPFVVVRLGEPEARLAVGRVERERALEVRAGLARLAARERDRPEDVDGCRTADLRQREDLPFSIGGCDRFLEERRRSLAPERPARDPFEVSRVRRRTDVRVELLERLERTVISPLGDRAGGEERRRL